MPTIAFCHDGPDAFRLREQLFQAHSRHVLDQLRRLRLAAPLALSDGAAVAGDHELAASLFVFADDSAETARNCVGADPYLSSGAWSRVDVYQTQALFGRWSPEREQQRAAFVALAGDAGLEPGVTGCRPYVVACEEAWSATAPDALRLEHGRYIARFFDRMALGVQLDPALVIGEGEGAHWRALYVFEALSLEEARRIALDDPFAREGAWRPEVFAVPAAIGSWAAGESN